MAGREQDRNGVVMTGVAIVDEGGAMIHIHARTPDGTPSYEVEDFQAITEAIRAEVGEAVIINFSTGTIGVPVAKRVAYLRACRPEVAALNMGSMNYAKYSRTRKDFVFKAVFANPFEEIIELLEAMDDLGIKPEHECFDVGHVGSLAPLIDMGVLRPPLHVDCVMGAEGAVEIVMRKQVEEADDPQAKKAELIEAYRKIIDVYIAAGNDMIDDVIDPRETRPTICRALEMAQGKRVERPWKRHGVVPV